MNSPGKREGRQVARVASRAFLFLVCVVFTALGLLFVQQKRVEARLANAIRSFKADTTLLRVVVLSQSDQSVSARFSFFDGDGEEVAAFERSWNGGELAVESVVVPLGERALVFPVRVFTDLIEPHRGTELSAYYDNDGVPSIYDSVLLAGATRTDLAGLFSRVRGIGDGSFLERSLDSLLGSSSRDVKRLRNPEIGAVYALTAGIDGETELVRE